MRRALCCAAVLLLVYHATFSINSLSHLIGTRRYATDDESRNNLFLALITLGEGWHNNHHHYQSSANQGFRWWEIDVSYYLIRLLACLGLVWDVRRPPRAKLLAVPAGHGPAARAAGGRAEPAVPGGAPRR